MWPFKKELVPQDTTDVIYLGNRFFPLQCDPQLYKESLADIKCMMSEWIHQELDMEEQTQASEYSLLRALHVTDVRNLGWGTSMDQFLKLLSDSAISCQCIRMEDLIVRISINIPTEVLETITGKFLYGVLYKTRRIVNRERYPGKEEWAYSLREVPWIPLLPIFQEVLDKDNAIQRLAKKSGATVVTVGKTIVS